MNLDDFEQKLRSQPVRRLPQEWKHEILSAAKPIALPLQPPADPEPRGRAWWLELLWPHPVAWAGLAAAWILVAVAHWAWLQDNSAPQLAASEPESPEVRLVLAEQRQLRRELLHSGAQPLSVPHESVIQPSSADRPRSSRAVDCRFG